MVDATWREGLVARGQLAASIIVSAVCRGFSIAGYVSNLPPQPSPCYLSRVRERGQWLCQYLSLRAPLRNE